MRFPLRASIRPLFAALRRPLAAQAARHVSHATSTATAAATPRRSIIAEQFDFEPVNSDKDKDKDKGDQSLANANAAALADLPPPPPGVSPDFHAEQYRLVERMHNARLSEGISALAALVRTQKDVDIFRPLVREFRIKGHNFTQADRTFIIAALRSIGAYDSLLQVLCDYPAYRLVPSESDLLALFQHFAAAATTPSARSNESEHIDALDKLYKCFAMGIYHGIPPSPRYYSLLITAGANGGTAEGLRRSVMTARELESLGWPLEDDAASALANAQKTAGDQGA